MDMDRKLYLSDQGEDARRVREGSLDRTTQASGQHSRDDFYDQGEDARRVGEGGERGRDSLDV